MTVRVDHTVPIYLSHYISTYLCISLHISTYLYISLYISTFLSISLHIYFHLSLSLHMYPFIYLTTYIPIYLIHYMYIYLFIYLKYSISTSLSISLHISSIYLSNNRRLRRRLGEYLHKFMQLKLKCQTNRCLLNIAKSFHEKELYYFGGIQVKIKSLMFSGSPCRKLGTGSEGQKVFFQKSF